MTERHDENGGTRATTERIVERLLGNGRTQILSPGNVLTILGMILALAASYGVLSADNADTKRRVEHLEKGEQKTHELIGELKREMRETKDGVNLILQEVRSMQAVERERERARRGRDLRSE